MISRSQLALLMESKGIGAFDELHRWSVSDPDAFWGSVIEALEIDFERRPRSIRGSVDPRQPEWLPGAVYNIVASCLDHGDDAVAIYDGRGDHVRRTCRSQDG